MLCFIDFGSIYLLTAIPWHFGKLRFQNIGIGFFRFCVRKIFQGILPFSAFCRVIHAGVSADVGGNGVAFLDTSKIAADVPPHSFRLSIMLAACRQPQLFVFPACGRGYPTMVSLPQPHRHFQYRHHFILRPCVLPAQTGQPVPCARLWTDACHSWLCAHFHQTFLWVCGVTSAGVNGAFFTASHCFANSVWTQRS